MLADRIHDQICLPSLIYLPARRVTSAIGLATEFRSEKIPRNRLGTVSGNSAEESTVLIPSQFRSSELNEITWKMSFTNNHFQQKELRACFHPWNASEWNSKSLLLFLFPTELRVVFFSAIWFKTESQVFASIFVTRNRIPRCFLFRRMVQNGILRVSFYFCSTVQNSEHFFSSAEWFGSKFQKF